jgi:hypothetical protein
MNRINVDKYFRLLDFPYNVLGNQRFDIFSEDFPTVRKSQYRTQFHLCLVMWTAVLFCAVTRVKDCGCVYGVLLCVVPWFKDVYTREICLTILYMYMGSHSFLPCFRDFDCAPTNLYFFILLKKTRNCLKHFIGRKIEGGIEVTWRRRRRHKLLDDRKEKRSCWNWKEEALDHTLWRTRFGRGYGPVVRQTAEGMKPTQRTYNIHSGITFYLSSMFDGSEAFWGSFYTEVLKQAKQWQSTFVVFI